MVFSIRLNEVQCTPLLVILVLVFRWVCIHAIDTSSCLGCLLLALHGLGDLEQKVLINVWLVTLYGWIDWDV